MNASLSHPHDGDLVVAASLNDAVSPTAQFPDSTSALDRRTAVLGGAAAAGAVVAATAADARASGNRFFKHGVASGDPRPRSVVLWTRVTPTPTAQPGSGRGPKATVTWQVATDRGFRDIVRRGRHTTGPARDHTVKVDATGLKPARWYYYRFWHQGVASRVGRTRTAPTRGADVRRLRFGMVSCANLQAGWFSAYRHLADRDDLQAIIHLGDYVYEYAPGQYGYGSADQDIRAHVPAREMVSLSDYRQRHAQYKQDPDLQRLHASLPWIVTWDDHEHTNDAWKAGAENHNPGEGNWKKRLSRSHRAYDEWMPVRMGGTARLGDGTRLYRKLKFGRLAELSMLDLRTYRDSQVLSAADGKVSSPDRSIAGRAQLNWLTSFLRNSTSQWKLVGNPVMIAPVSFLQLPHDLVDPINDVTKLLPADGLAYNIDQWDGYTYDRRRIFEHIRNQGINDTVFLTGDIHSSWACDLPFDPGSYPLSKDCAGVEFVCASVTSNNLKDILGVKRRTVSLGVEGILQTANPHIKHLNFDDHGYAVLDITPARVQVDYYVIGDRAVKNTPSHWTASWKCEAGTQRLQAAAKPVGA